VSVVATGIEAEAAHQPQPGKVFAVPRATTATPVQAAPIAPVAMSAIEEEETLELTEEMDEGDELVLDSDDVLTAPVGSAPIAPPVDEDEIMPEAASIEEKPKVRDTGTLFERMSNIARGAAQAQVGEEESTPSYRREPIDIPRFLNRQNNQ
jgi:cell division protein FtsZ